MTAPSILSDTVASVRAVVTNACSGLVERAALADALLLAAVAGEHVLVIGPPGTAKSEIVRRMANAIDATYFEYLLGRFTEPSEVFGTVDLARLRDGVVETRTSGMLPEAEIAFLDEIFLGSTAILNTLLGILNERRFRRGHTVMTCPLRVCIAASNTLPDDETLQAVADRFLVRVFVSPVADTNIEAMLAAGWALGNDAHTEALRASLADIDRLHAAARTLDMTPVQPAIGHAIRLLRRSDIAMSDRRVVKTQRLIAAAAVLAGRERPTDADLWPLLLAVPTAHGQVLAKEVLRDLLATSENPTLIAGAEAVANSTGARAARIVGAARDAFAIDPAASDRQAWLVRLEFIAREIDASFAPASLPPGIAEVRQKIAGILQPVETP